jgi:hypothetical protein
MQVFGSLWGCVPEKQVHFLSRAFIEARQHGL